MTLEIGDRVTLPSGKIGVIIYPPWLMPCHHLIQFSDGSNLWVLREILNDASARIIDHHSVKRTA